jgi:hypothetical protein
MMISPAYRAQLAIFVSHRRHLGWRNKASLQHVDDVGACEGTPVTGGTQMISLLLLVVLLMLLIGALPRWGYSSGWGYYPSGGIGLVLIIVLLLVLLGYI